jgi:Raf kinase inhibitor-like YbhB/YbcL family protein
MRAMFLFVLIGLVGCRSNSAPSPPSPANGVTPASVTVSSAAFASGGAIGADYTCDGTDRSPQLAWSAMPSTAKTVAFVVDDPDAPSGTFTHWIAWNIKPDARTIADGANAVTVGGASGTNDFGRIGYGGPCPPRGQLHHYHFRIYGLDASLTLRADAKRAEMDAAMSGHVVALGELVGTFQH